MISQRVGKAPTGLVARLVTMTLNWTVFPGATESVVVVSS
jgi:hypothetical protein